MDEMSNSETDFPQKVIRALSERYFEQSEAQKFGHKGFSAERELTGDFIFNNEWNQMEKLGSGGCADVYLCQIKRTAQKFALKQVRLPSKSFDEHTDKRVKSLMNEVMLLKTCDHIRFVRCFGLLQDDLSFNIFLEYMPGGSLLDKLKRDGPFAESLIKCYNRQCLEGLLYLHDQQIVHKDIKTANILLDSHENIKLADFGLGKKFYEAVSSLHTKKVGTLIYMAPELFTAQPYGRKVDMWSLACVLVELLLGQLPWSSLEPNQWIYTVCSTDHIFEKYKLTVSVSMEMENYLKLLFAKNPTDRPYAKEAMEHLFLK